METYVGAETSKNNTKCKNEPQRKKTYQLTCAPNEDSNQPAHPRSLIRVFVVKILMKIHNEDSDQTA